MSDESYLSLCYSNFDRQYIFSYIRIIQQDGGEDLEFVGGKYTHKEEIQKQEMESVSILQYHAITNSTVDGTFIYPQNGTVKPTPWPEYKTNWILYISVAVSVLGKACQIR